MQNELADQETEQTAMPMSRAADALLNRHDLMDRYDVTEATIYRWINLKDFPKPLKLGGRTSRWRYGDLIQWENNQAAG